MEDILLIEPAYKNKYPPIGLMKIAYFHRYIMHDYVRFAKGRLPEGLENKKWDRVYVTTLFKREVLGLDGYIPFHFHPYSAFDVAVKKTHVGEEMIYICITRILARRNNFRILPKHPLALEECQLYNYDEGFEMIDWDILTRVGQNDEDARQIKMAECLSPLVIPVDAFQCIYVSSKETENKVADMLKQKGVIFPPPFITVMPQWFE